MASIAKAWVVLIMLNHVTVYAIQVRKVNRMKHIEAFHLIKAHEIWVAEWVAQGQTHEGSCTGGKGLRIWYRGPRKRSAINRLAVDAPPVQGNLSASRSYEPAWKYLKDQGIESTYYDGWMN